MLVFSRCTVVHVELWVSLDLLEDNKAEAILQAAKMKRSFTPPTRSEEEEEYDMAATRTLWVGNLAVDITHAELRKLCDRYGEVLVRRLSVILNCFSCFSLGFD